ncbi:extracelular serine carboxypeptidase [Rhodotorula toruloides]|uniref:Extracelular serine carboxypeptidase n=1 Tax=Rhodotorula toruloides TaxID=5286 RepID=A0A511KIV3_RHOTO|nr:extracelular serine carboxypeptidase [Rhodotorula toruloides]
MHTASVFVLGLLGSLALAVRPLSSNQLASKGTTPALPLGLWKEAKRRQRLDNGARVARSTGQAGQIPFLGSLKQTATHQEHFFDQLVSHDPHIAPTTPGETWQQRYWFDATFYKPGGPVFLLDAGETDGEGRLPFLSQGILRILSEATGGLGIVFEHRYYGKSFPVANLTTDSLRFLTTRQSLDDGAHFARNVVLPGLEHVDIQAPGSTPWIYYGGSYAGAKAALARKLFPDVFAGGIASSAVTAAIEDYWQYYEPIRQNGPPECIDRLVNHTSLIDSLLAYQQPALTTALKGYFGLGNVTSDADFVNALAIPLGFWQARNWDHSVGSTRFFEFCDALAANASLAHISDLFQPAQLAVLPSLPQDPRTALARFAAYASYIREHIAILCPPDTAQDHCFGTDQYSGDELDDYEWKSWAYQVCTEWGYFIGAPPDREHPSLVSRLLTTDYTSKICRKAFMPGELNSVPARPNVTVINQYGAFNFSYPRLAFIDGSEDPWIYATPHSPLAPHHGQRRSTTSEPFLLIKGGAHHWDENGRPTRPEPEEIQRVHREEVEFVRVWLEEWREEQRERERKRKGRWRWGEKESARWA